MKMFKKILGGLFVFSIFGTTLAQNPSFNFVPASGTELKLHCNYDFNVSAVVDGWSYNGFAYAIKFNTGDTTISHISIDPWFDQSPGSSILNDIYRAWGSAGSKNSTLDRNLTSFGFKSLLNITQTELVFTTYTGGQLGFGLGTTDDGTTLDGYATGGDNLMSAPGATYTFVPLPCVVDSTAPSIVSINPSNGSRYISGDQVISFTTYDWAGAGNVNGTAPLATNNRSHYWYQGLSTASLNNYVAAPVSVDNQEGVNSSTIKATVSCPTCDSFGVPYVLTAANLVISDWAGDASHNQYTWNSNTRGYDVYFAAPATYEIEKQVTVNIESVDNPNELGAVHTGTTSFSFNAPQVPTITRLLPATSTFVSPSKENVISLFVSDDWAGVNTGSLKITIPTIISGVEQLLTGYTYSGSELNFTLSGGSESLGNSGKYVVDFYSNWDLPANKSVVITGSVLDLAGNEGVFSTSFVTRPDCSYFGCNEILNINISEGLNIGNYIFTGSKLIVTGTNLNSPYPYITGTNNDIVVCGYEWTGSVLSGNIQIYDSTGTLINGTNYSGNALYITGLNFTIVDGVIIVQ